jgi:4-hydroxybenzoate polyprenyltransferase
VNLSGTKFPYDEDDMSWTQKLKVSLVLGRLHRPVGIWLLMFPGWWGVALASPQWPSFYLLFLFACGALFMRSAGCVYNDWVDKNIDREVKRTTLRPMAAGKISSREACALLAFFLMGGAFVLFSLPQAVIYTGFLALGLLLLYPWMKRITYWPQLFLGVTYNIGVLMGWLSLQPTLTLMPLLFYGGAILWTLGYDTIYGLQDVEDDLRIGVKSSALVVISMPKLFLTFVYGGVLFLWAMGGKEAQLGQSYWIFLGIIALQLGWQIFSLNPQSPPDCLKKFESNVKIGLLLFLAIVFSHIID